LKIIEDEWLWFSTWFIEDEWSKLLMMNDQYFPYDLLEVNDYDYWWWMIQIIDDESFKLLNMNVFDYWRLLKMNDQNYW
jgi:hypothetical protein